MTSTLAIVRTVIRFFAWNLHELGIFVNVGPYPILGDLGGDGTDKAPSEIINVRHKLLISQLGQRRRLGHRPLGGAVAGCCLEHRMWANPQYQSRMKSGLSWTTSRTLTRAWDK